MEEMEKKLAAEQLNEEQNPQLQPDTSDYLVNKVALQFFYLFDISVNSNLMS